MIENVAGGLVVAGDTCAAYTDVGLPARSSFVARLLADQHHLRLLRAFAEHDLRRIFPEMTGAAAAGFFAQDFKTTAGLARC